MLQPAQAPSLAQAAPRAAKRGPSKAQQAFQRGLVALAQWVEREGDGPVPRGAVVEIEADGETEPVTTKLGAWISNTKSRGDRLDADQLAVLAQLGIDRAHPVTIP
ncbi:helicase associated domain-containing protein [Streptomyces sp. NPDC058872]|uniref:helicase associated domain-containing protein n=1 Tax=Streptomyces sp. NPDC058872 TaxID=3346661 RepID=UPI0036B7E7D3